MELWQYQKNDLEFVALPVTAECICFSICDEDGPVIWMFVEEIEPVKKAA